MRPLQLTMNAYGPYAKETQIDFDKINDGLYLIAGDTGSGKTSIFDAITYALYGEASGSQRDEAKMLRSDYAEPSEKTFVRLKFLHKNEEYIIERSPAYRRPKKRGEGLTEEPSQVRLTLPNSIELEEVNVVNESIEEILGMNVNEFKQIIILAQGEFLKLLNASSKERADIFRKIFNTNDYLKFQDSLNEKSKEIKKKLDKNYQKLNEMTKTYQLTSTEMLLEYLEHQVNLLNRKIDNIEQGLEEKEKIREKLSIQMSQIQEEQKIQEAIKLKRKQLQALLLKEGQIEKQKAMLKDMSYYRDNLHFPYLSLKKNQKNQLKYEKELVEMKKEFHEKEREYKETINIFIQYKNKSKFFSNRAIHLKEMEDQLKILNRLDLLEKEFNRWGNERNILESEYLNLKSQREDVLKNIEKVQVARKESLSTQVEINEVQLHIGDLTEKYHEIYQNYKSWLHVLELTDELEKQRRIVKELERSYQKTLKDYIDYERDFYLSQAGILADELKEGEPCPVCGSKEHPKKAILKEHMSQKTLESKRHNLDKAKEALQKHRNHSETLQKRIASDTPKMEYPLVLKEKNELKKHLIQEKKNLTVLQERIDVLNDFIDKEKTILKDKAVIDQEIDVIEKKLSRLDLRLTETKVKMAEDQSKVSNLEINQLNKKYYSEKEALKQDQELYELYRNKVQNFDKALTTVKTNISNLMNTLEQNAREMKENKLLIEDLLKDKNIKLEEMKELYDQFDRIEKEVSEYEQLNYRLKVDIKNLEFNIKYGDLNQLQNISQRYEELKNEIRKEKIKLKDYELSIFTYKQQIDEFKKIYKEYQKSLEEYSIYESLNRTMNGALSGQEKLDLETYVQTAYFEYIIHEANHRFKTMTNHRYELRRQEEAQNLRTKTGLDLNVFDFYTGKERSVKTLSGGESFKAALCLALALSSVVSSFAGGVHVDALFIDEGFGSLDPESLEQAMKALLDLSKENKLIGIISHVPTLKETISQQILVKKGEKGSSIELRTGL